jgi:hypothetical protein
MASSGLFPFVLLVWGCFGSGCANDRRDRDVRDLLPSCTSIRWDSYIAASIRLSQGIRACISSSVRSGLRCVGDLHASRISADLVRSADYSTPNDICDESAAETTFASSWMKRQRLRLRQSSLRSRFGGLGG